MSHGTGAHTSFDVSLFGGGQKASPNMTDVSIHPGIICMST